MVIGAINGNSQSSQQPIFIIPKAFFSYGLAGRIAFG